jgi:hypothetical protein
MLGHSRPRGVQELGGERIRELVAGGFRGTDVDGHLRTLASGAVRDLSGA